MKISQNTALLASLGLIGQALGQNNGMPVNPFAPSANNGGMPSNPFNNNNGGGVPPNPFNNNNNNNNNGGGGTCPCPAPAEIPVLQDQPGCPAVRASEPTSPEDLTINPNLICPRDEGQLYQTTDGATFMIQCCAHGVGGPQIGPKTVEPDFRACMRKCAVTDNCHSVTYTAQDKQNEPVGLCALYEQGGFSTTHCGVHDQHNYAFVITPPPVAAKDEPLGVKCLAECPYGDGQLFRTESGETFQLTCGKRAGTDYIHSDTQDSMMDCMGACGRLIQCASADYDVHRKICYYTSGKSKPSIEAKSFASARSMGCGGVCGPKPDNQCCA